MKKTNLLSAITFLFIMVACVGTKDQLEYDLITVDVNAKYPKKELILQDFMDVEYIALESSDEYITQGVIKAVGEKIIIVSNRSVDGNIFIFDRKNGKGLIKINRLGQGPEEYSQFTDIILDEDNNEMFVIAYSSRKILVYDLYGNFKRKFKFVNEMEFYNYTFNYDNGS